MGWGGGGGLGGGMGGGHGAFGSETDRKKRTVSDLSLLRRLMTYARPYKSRLIVLIVSLVTSSLFNTLMPALHKIAIDQIIGPAALDGFLWWVPIFIGVTIAIFITQYVQQYMTAFVGENMISNLRLDMVKQLQILSLRYF